MPTEVARHARVMTLSSAQVAQELVSTIGAPLTAVIGGATSTRSVRNWMLGDGPREADVVRLRAALQIVDELKLRFENDIVKAWLTGMNPLLDDKSPLLVLADEDTTTFPIVLQAARRFIAEQ